MMNFVYLLIGVALPGIGGEALIRGSMSVAKRLNISPLLRAIIRHENY